ncbi:MAG: glycosyl hydrolase family 18 protein [Romboutsia sp.]|uniref:glycosyl hydrolase family 18 protein n=1 Tax=Romboutsia sp. TaxID=1965302 RepID=UPI003F2CD274
MKRNNKMKKIVASSMMATMMTSAVAPTVQIVANADEKSTIQTTKSDDLDRKLVGYFPEWSYSSKEHNYFDAADLQWDDLTHIQYSFAQVNPKTNKIDFWDRNAAIEEDFSEFELTHKGEKVTIDESLPYKGHFNIIQQMKKKYPDVKVTMSVGGWAASRGFYTMLDTDEGIDTFVQSCVDFLREYNLDGIDIDFEFPSATSQSGNPDDFDLSEPRRKTINARYNVMMKKLNEALDQAGQEDGKEYLCTAAVSASSWVLGGVEDNSYAKELDFLSMMTYDFHGGWNKFVENQANIYGDPADNETSGMLMPVLSSDWAFKYYRGTLPSEKILMGIPYYTRGWENVQGGNGTGLHGTSDTPATGKYNVWADLDANGNPIPAGVNPIWHVLNLMEQDPNLELHWDEVGKVPYLWQDEEKVFLSFENEKSIDERLKYIEENNMGGALIWVMDADYGLNPNYVQGSTDINEGKYTFGNTLTKRLADGLKAMGPAQKTEDEDSSLQPIAVEVEQTGTYDHPNYTYDFKITNHTDEAIKGGWELAFDLPKSAVFKSTWGGEYSIEDKGHFNRVTLKSSGWQTLEPGATTNLSGMIGLCFSGVKNVTFNGKKPVGNVEVPEVNQAPVLNGVSNKTITVGDKFDALAGVTATDDHDGNITKKIVVKGEVNTALAGEYPLTYSVVDSKGLETVAKRTITVKEKTVTPDPEVNTAPVFTGVEDKTIKVGQIFDALAGVTATDKEDGPITSKINVSGKVNTAIAGKYPLTYTVEDSKGLETVAKRTITVESDVVEGDTYDSNTTYYGGEIVTYKGQEYKAKWWVKGEAPDQSQAWEKIVKPNEDGTIDWYEGMVCVGGDVITYNGKTYEAKWWTTSTPGSDDSWKLIG